jgi:uncharacterized protein
MKRVLLVTAGFFHPPYRGRLELDKSLARLDCFTFQHAGSMERLPQDLESYSALVIYIHHKKISQSALAALDSFVAKGGGILAIHSATASFKETMHYFEILGGRFIGHGAIENIEIKHRRSEIFGQIGNLVVRDELYLHDLQPGIAVHFTAKHAGQDVPVVWTYRYGKGKVCYAVPGHTTATMRNPIYQQILQRGLSWVTE